MAETRTATRFFGLDTVALLELVRAGNQDAYGELFSRYHDFAYKVARRANRRHADDLVSEAFRRVLTAISRGAGPTQGFGPYLAATIRSAGAGLAAPYQEVELDVSTILTDEHGDVDPRVSTAYMALPEQWQNALWYSDVEGLSPRHAAPLLGLPSANAFSALRKRARAGLRSAYLTQVVDEACNEPVRRHLELLMAGKVGADEVDALVDEHLHECDECAAIAWRVAAVTGNRVGMVLAPAVLAFHGFAISGALLPAGFGLPSFLWLARRIPKSAVAAGSTVATVGLVAATVVAGQSLGGSADPPAATAPAVAPSPTVAATTVAPTTTMPPTTTTSNTTTTSTSTTSTTSTTTTSSTTMPPTTVAAPPPPPPPPPTTTTPPPPPPTTTTPPPPPPTTTTTTSTTVPSPTVPSAPTTEPPPISTVPPPPTTVPPPPTTEPPPPTTEPPPPPTPPTMSVTQDGQSDNWRVEVQLVGEPATIWFSQATWVSNTSSNVACDGVTTRCTLDPISDTATLRFSRGSSSLTITLFDAAGEPAASWP